MMAEWNECTSKDERRSRMSANESMLSLCQRALLSVHDPTDLELRILLRTQISNYEQLDTLLFLHPAEC